MRALPLAVLAVLAAPAFAADQPLVNPGATRLDIDATGEVARTPDMVLISAGVVTQGATAARALSDNAQRMTATIAALRHTGLGDRDLQTSAVRLQPQYRYADGLPPAITGYQATNQIAVRLHDVAGSGKVLDALVAAGANQIDGPNLTVDKPEVALDEARTQALATARARAELYAKAAGLHVRRIAQISETGTDVPVARPMAMMMAKRADTPIEAGESRLGVTLHVTFELDQFETQHPFVLSLGERDSLKAVTKRPAPPICANDVQPLRHAPKPPRDRGSPWAGRCAGGVAGWWGVACARHADSA